MGAYDLGELGPAQVASSGLQGLLEAYKMKLAQATEEAKIKQSGYNAFGTSEATGLRLSETLNNHLEVARLKAAAAGGGVNPNDIAGKIYRGEMAPSQMATLGRGPVRAQVMQALYDIDPKFDMTAAETKYKQLGFQASQPAMTRSATAQSISPLLDGMETELGTSGLTRFPLLNKLKAAGHYAVGSTKMSGVSKSAQAISDELQAMVGQGSDAKLKLAQSLLGTTDSPAQMKQGIDMVRAMINGRTGAFTGGIPEPQSRNRPVPGALPAPDAHAAPVDNSVEAELRRRGVIE